MIQNSSKSLLMLVNDILDLTKLQSSRLRIENEAFSLATAVRKIERRREEREAIETNRRGEK